MESVVMAVVDFIPLNPIRRGLVGRAIDWTWFSAGWNDSDKSFHDPDLPTIHGLPWDFFP